jgi:hypothetical protein
VERCPSVLTLVSGLGCHERSAIESAFYCDSRSCRGSGAIYRVGFVVVITLKV